MKLTIPDYAVKNNHIQNISGVNRKREMNGEILVTDKVIAKNLDFGINGIVHDSVREELTLSLSAKILKKDYSQGISINSIERVIAEVNKIKFLELSTEDVLKNGIVRRVDVVNNLEVQQIEKSIDAVYRCGLMNSKYSMSNFKKNSLGYEAKRNVKSYRERQIGYSKSIELKRNGGEFLKAFPSIINSIGQNTLRIESNHISFARIRKELLVPSTILLEVLNSNEKVNHKIFERIVCKSKNENLLSNQYENLGFKEIRNQIGYEGIFKNFDNDLSLVEDWIKSVYERGKHSYYIKLIREAYFRMTKETQDYSNHKIEEISQLLKSA